MKSFLSLCFVTLVLSCSAQTRSDGRIFTNVTNEEAKQLIASAGHVQIIDVRQTAEVSKGMIQGARQIDISKPNFASEINKLDKTAPVLVYCAFGARSQTAMKIMEENGFQAVYNLSGGYDGWK